MIINAYFLSLAIHLWIYTSGFPTSKLRFNLLSFSHIYTSSFLADIFASLLSVLFLDPAPICFAARLAARAPFLPVLQGMLVSLASVLRSKLEMPMSSRWLVAVLSHLKVVAVERPVEIRYLTLRTSRHLVAVDALGDKDSGSFFAPVLPKTAKLYLPVHDPLLRKSLSRSSVFLCPSHPLASGYFRSTQVDGSSSSAYVEYPEMTLAEFQEYHDRMSHTLFSKQDLDYPFSGQLGNWPARNLPALPPEHGEPFLLPPLLVGSSSLRALPRSNSPASVEDLDFAHDANVLFGKPEMLDTWIVASALPGPDQPLPPPGLHLRVFPTTLRDVFWAIKDEPDRFVPGKAETRLRYVPLPRFPFRKPPALSLFPFSCCYLVRRLCLPSISSETSPSRVPTWSTQPFPRHLTKFWSITVVFRPHCSFGLNPQLAWA